MPSTDAVPYPAEVGGISTHFASSGRMAGATQAIEVGDCRWSLPSTTGCGSTTASPDSGDHHPEPGMRSSVAEPPTAPSGNSSVVLDLTVNTAGAFAGMGLIYVFCGSITPQGGQNGVRLLSLEFTPRGAAGQPYFTWVDRILGESPRDIHGGESGCFGSMSDPVVGRAAASTFAAKVGYASGGRTRIAEFSGPVVRPP